MISIHEQTGSPNLDVKICSKETNNYMKFMYEVIYPAYQGVSFYKDCIPTLLEKKRRSKLSLYMAITDFIINIAMDIVDSENIIV